MLSYLAIHNIFVSDVHMDDIAYAKYRLCHLYLEHYCIQQKMIKIDNIYASITIANINNWFFV